ncbi:MAG: sigma-70 family RNA polymerase sigma factor, partial [Gemmataceae bacterium]
MARPVEEPARQTRFVTAVLPHLDAAYNLARWLTGNDHDAEDVVQEAYLRALRFFDGFHGDDGRTWLLAVVRNTCFTWLKRNRRPTVPLRDELNVPAGDAFDPTRSLQAGADGEALHAALEHLSLEFREAIVLRELEGLSYKKIAAVTGVPMGTVMSRLARGRDLLRRALEESDR